MLYNIIVAPIESIVGWIFLFIINKIPSIGVIGAICGVSIAINILALPLYNKAESIQEKERQINKKLEPRVKRIKKGFKGDEQFMMLSEYYRQNGYHPLYALRGSLSILIEIPFFIAAYNYLSSSEILKESSFWIFSNLGEADRMFSITLGSLVIPINILPIIMTLINFVSGYIYTKGSTKRDKIQLYAMGLFFLVLLYSSPSGLVIYWILNNIFSLVKTVVLKFFKHPGYVLYLFVSLGLLAFAYKFRNASDRSRAYFAFIVAILFILTPLFLLLYKKSPLYTLSKKIKSNRRGKKSYFPFVLFSSLGLAFLCGFLLPASAIASSPEEFSYLGSISNPSSFVWSTLYFYIGLFVFWPLVIYKMFREKVRKGEAILLFALLVTALLDAFVFKGDYGKLSTQFYCENVDTLENITLMYTIGPILAILLSAFLFFLFDYFGKLSILTLLCLSITITEGAIGTAKMVSIRKAFKNYTELLENNESSLENNNEVESVYHLSRNGKNVVVIFLDRAPSIFLPYTIEQMPELEEQLRGFVFYPNTVSFGTNTTFGSPAMLGGYEYTPELMNSRDGLLKDLHNEALLLAPTLFSDAGYSVTVSDPPFSNYSWRGDLSEYENLEGIKAIELYSKNTEKYFKEIIYEEYEEDVSLITKDEAINFSMLEIMPPFFRYMFEMYCRNVANYDYKYFAYNFANLYFLRDLTDFTEENNTYTFIGNESTHQPVALESSLLRPASEEDSFESNYPADDMSTYKHYTSFTASLKQIGRWLDYLRENSCYDNTRIIIVSDHGSGSNNPLVTSKQSSYMPLLLVKDFNSNDKLKYDYTFMTNADTILLSIDNLDGVSKINPYTGNTLKEEKNDGINAYPVLYDIEWNAPKITSYTEFTLDKTQGWHIKDNIFDQSNWIHISEWEEMNK